jgi:DNA-binding HxlR family transcriptional regulator
MSDKERLILQALHDRKKQWNDLERLLVKSGKMARSTLSRNLDNLQRDGKISRAVDNSKKPPVVWYALSDFEPELERIVRKAVEKLRQEFAFLREPTVKEVAARVGKTPEIAYASLYKLSPKIKWREQNLQEAEKEAGDAINLAGWVRWIEKGEHNMELKRMAEEAEGTASKDTLVRARDILKNFPSLVPDVEPTGFKWPEETRRTWSRIFGSSPPPAPVFGVGVRFSSHSEVKDFERRTRELLGPG